MLGRCLGGHAGPLRHDPEQRFTGRHHVGVHNKLLAPVVHLWPVLTQQLSRRAAEWAVRALELGRVPGEAMLGLRVREVAYRCVVQVEWSRFGKLPSLS